jgi:hypothetical protein
MSQPHQIRAAWKYAKDYAAALVAAEFMFSGARTFISVLKYPAAVELLKLTNAVIRKGFRGWTLLQEYYAQPPWWYQVRIAAGGAIAITLGVLIGLWANSIEQRGKPSDP